jgi:glycosyltransferase involved in cell wall biosynthesis
MKLLHVVASYLPARRYGGTIVSVHGLCRALAARGHEVHVYTTSVDGAGDSDVPHGVPVDIDGVKVWYFASPHLRRIYRSPALGAALQRHVGEFAVVHTHAIYLWPLWTAARMAQRAGVPYVVSPRGMLEKELIEQKSAWMKSALIAFVERRTLEGAAAIHVTSGREADEAASFGFNLRRVCEIPNGVEAEMPSMVASPHQRRLSPVIDQAISGGPFLLFLGRINWKKGLDRLVAALTQAPGVRLVIAGNDEDGYQRIVEGRAAAAGVVDRMVFAGPVMGDDKAALMSAARGLVLPSYSENFGNVVLEAMAAGRPVIVTPEVGVAGLVEESGAGLVVSGGAEPLGAAMMALMLDARRGDEMGLRGRETARRFSWESVAEQMERVYDEVAGAARITHA